MLGHEAGSFQCRVLHPFGQACEDGVDFISRPADEQVVRAKCDASNILPSASRDPVFGGKSRTKTHTPENAYGFVELIPRLYHHTKGSSWEHSGGRLERFQYFWNGRTTTTTFVDVVVVSTNKSLF